MDMFYGFVWGGGGGGGGGERSGRKIDARFLKMNFIVFNVFGEGGGGGWQFTTRMGHSVCVFGAKISRNYRLGHLKAAAKVNF